MSSVGAPLIVQTVNNKKIAFFSGLLLLGAAIAYQPMAVLTLFLGVPALLLVGIKKTRFIGLLTILALAPFLGIIKAFTGVRLAPLAFDIALLILVTFTVLDEIFSYKFKISLLEILVLFFLILGVIQIFNPNVPSTIIGLAGFRATAFQSLAIFAGIYLVKTKKQLKQIAMVVIISSLPVAVYAVKQFFYPGAVDFKIISSSLASPITYTALGKMRAFSTLSSPFHLGIFMVLAILLAAQPIWPKKAIARILIITILSLALIMTITRANWLAAAAGISIIILAPMLIKRARLSFKSILPVGIIFLTAFLLISLAPYYFSNPAYEYLTSLENIQSTSRYQGTIANWQQVIIPAMAKNPFGYGAGSAGDGINREFIGPSFTSHNIFLKMGLELGVIGLILFTTIIILAFTQGAKVFYKLSDKFLSRFGLWILSFMAAILVAGLSAPITDAYPANLYFWLLMGILLNLGKTEKTEKNSNETLIKEAKNGH